MEAEVGMLPPHSFFATPRDCAAIRQRRYRTMTDARTTPDPVFLLAEYESLRTEQIEKIRQTFSLTQFAVISTGAMWAWLATNEIQVGHEKLVAWAPLLLSSMLTGLYWALRRDVEILGETIAALEGYFKAEGKFAWERDVGRTFTRTRIIHWALWIVLLTANLGVGLIYGV